MIEYITNEEQQLAIIIRNNFDKEGITFVTPDEYSQQMAYMHHSQGHIIQPHFHNKIERTVQYTQEVLVIKKGRLKVNFYNLECDFLKSTEIKEGDIILLCSGGHGFEVIEETVMVEVKQGPYIGEADKTRFIAK